MATKIESASKDISVFYQDVLRRLWLESIRPDTYMKDQKFRYFWDDKEQVKK